MDQAGVDTAILLGWYWQTPAACELQNTFLAQCHRQHPDRLQVCAAVHPDSSRSPETQVLRWRDEGFCGLGELSPHSISGGDPNGDSRWDEWFAAAGVAGLPVNLHVTDPRSRSFPGKVDTPLGDFLKWGRNHSATTFVLAHGGGRMPWFTPEVLSLPNVVFDMAAFPLLYPPPSLDAWVAQCGASKLCWGSDHPLDLYPKYNDEGSWARWRAAIDQSGWGDEVSGALLGGNAMRVFNLG